MNELRDFSYSDSPEALHYGAKRYLARPFNFVPFGERLLIGSAFGAYRTFQLALPDEAVAAWLRAEWEKSERDFQRERDRRLAAQPSVDYSALRIGDITL